MSAEKELALVPARDVDDDRADGDVLDLSEDLERGNGAEEEELSGNWTFTKVKEVVVETITNQLFFVCMTIVILLAWAAPWIGKKGGPLATEWTVSYGVNALVFFISGLALKTKSLIDAFLNVKLNALIQSWVFGVMPALFYVIYLGLRSWSLIDVEIADGFCVLGCLPMTINMCYVLTSSANGNDSAALFNATFGNIIGIFVSPVLILGMLSVQGGVSYAEVILKLTYKVVVPLVAGQLLLNFGPEGFRQWLLTVKKEMKLSQEFMLSLVVYASFCNTFAADVDTSAASIIIVGLFIVVIQCSMFAAAWWFYTLPFLGFDVKDSIAGMFCSVHKTMALGVPMISSMYEDSDAGSGIYTIPLLVYHPMLAITGSILVPRLKAIVEAAAETEGAAVKGAYASVSEEGNEGPVGATFGIFGARGNVGAWVLEDISKHAKKGDSMVVFSRESGPVGVGTLRVIYEYADMSEPATVRAALRKYKLRALFLSMPQALTGEQMSALGLALAETLPTGGGTTVVRLSSYGLESSKASQGKLGEAHLRSEAALRAMNVPLVSIRPTSFFSNFDKYDLPALLEGSFNIFSPLGHAASARVNWVSCQDIGEVSAAYLRMAVEGTVTFGDGKFLTVEVTGGECNTFSLTEYVAMLTSVVEEVRGGGKVIYTDLPLPEEAEYGDLWRFLRAGGFDAVTDTVCRVLSREPLGLRRYITERLQKNS